MRWTGALATHSALAGLLCTLLPALAVRSAEFHAAPDGSPSGNGSKSRPWDLKTALSGIPAVRPGDTVWLHGGVYRGGFLSRLAGTETAPTTVRQAAGERATIDCREPNAQGSGFFRIEGPHVIFRDFEVACSDPRRITQSAGNWPPDISRGSVICGASGIKLINLVIHDLGNGVGFWAQGRGGEISGCLIFNNGWLGAGRGNGHGIYAQNAEGVKRLADNIIFNQFSYGIHCYGTARASLRGFQIEGNVCFNNGCLAGRDDPAPGIFIGGETPVANVQVVNNYLYNAPLHCGFPWGTLNEEAAVSGNYVVGGLYFRDYRKLQVTGNVVVAGGRVVKFEATSPVDWTGYAWDRNQYYRTGPAAPDFALLQENFSREIDFATWRQATGVDANSQLAHSPPKGVKVFVRPNPYEPGRANVIVYNWDRASRVDVDLTGVLAIGQQFRIVRAQDFYGDPVAEGTYQGASVPLELKPVPAIKPLGMPEAATLVTEPEFGVLVVLPVSSPT